MCICTPNRRTPFCENCPNSVKKDNFLQSSAVLAGSERYREWNRFAVQVGHHIETYTVQQYGDKGNDMASEMTAEECILQVQKYARRFGKNAREGQEKLDLMKIAHYAAIAFAKLTEGE